MGKQKMRFIHANSIEELEEKTNQLMDEGYYPQGNVIASSYVFNGNEVYYFYVQSMMLDD